MGIFAKPWQPLDLFANSTFMFWAILNSMATGLLANLLYLKGLSMNVEALKATIVTSVEVVFATLYGVLLLREEINSVGYVGIGIILISIVLMNMKIQSNPKESTENEVILEDRLIYFGGNDENIYKCSHIWA